MSLGSEEGRAEQSNSSQTCFQGNHFKMWSVSLIHNQRELSPGSEAALYPDGFRHEEGKRLKAGGVPGAPAHGLPKEAHQGKLL